MQLTIFTKTKFPHAYKLKTLGGKFSAEGEEYYEKYEEELSMEYDEILETITNRTRIGGTKKIHIFADVNSLRS